VTKGQHLSFAAFGGPAMANPEHVEILKQGVDGWNIAE